MKCQHCGSTRVLEFSGKCNDLYSASLGDREYNGYALHGVGLGGGDYVSGDLCLNCGQLQGKWPLPQCEEIEGEDGDIDATDEDGEYLRQDKAAYRERKRREAITEEPNLEPMFANMELTKSRKRRLQLIVNAYNRK